MTISTVWAFPNAVGGSTVIRGLAGEIKDRIPVSLDWREAGVHGWLVDPDDMPDLEAALSAQDPPIFVRESKNPLREWVPKVPDMTVEEAEHAVSELNDMADRFVAASVTFVERYTTVFITLVQRNGWRVLGYESFDALCDARLPFRLPQDVRREVVKAAVMDGLSISAAANIARTSQRTASRDLTSAFADVQHALTPNATGLDGRTVARHQQRDDGPPVTRRNQEPLVGNIVDFGSRRHAVEPPDLDLNDEPDFTCVENTLMLMEDVLLPERLLRPLASRVQSQIGRLAAGEER